VSREKDRKRGGVVNVVTDFEGITKGFEMNSLIEKTSERIQLLPQSINK
jgi:hypothetical protein